MEISGNASIKQRVVTLGLATALTVGGLLSLVPTAGAQQDETEFESDSGLVVTWDPAWEIDEDTPAGNSVLALVNDDFMFQFNEAEGDATDLEDFRDRQVTILIDGDSADPDNELIDTAEDDESASASLVVEEEFLGPDPREYFYYTYVTDDDLLVELRVWAPVGEIGDAFEAVEQDIEIDNDAPFASVETDEVVAGFEDGASTEDGTPEPDDEETPEPDDNGGDVDADEYLATVQDNYDELSEGYNRVIEILDSGDFTDAEFEEMTEIIDSWSDAADVAADLNAPKEVADVQDAYVAYAEELTAASDSFADFLSSDPDSAESDAALDDFVAALTNVGDLDAELEDALAAA